MRGSFRGRQFRLFPVHKQGVTVMKINYTSVELVTCDTCGKEFETRKKNEYTCLSCTYRIAKNNRDTRMNVLTNEECENMAHQMLEKK